ncbi:unnamed protein product [Phaedon cochleariae]|uniref:Uncharacterized protein n=1 Tax=Phaedon cochleariae TaxID=80249 RepID=A0A9N9SJN0_PHACE|nr:unnamed protein product [Phaedon cochleariae]
MTSQSITLPNAISNLNIDDADGSSTAVYKTAEILPQSLLSHKVEKDYIMMGMTPQDFIKTHGSSSVDFAQLQKDFTKICMNFSDTIRIDVKSMAVEFCSKMIYEVGPQARQVKKTGDKTWKFMFMYKVNDKLVVKVAFVSTYKKEEAQYVLEASNQKITLSVRNASLLAMMTLEKLNELAMIQTPSIMLLSPLAGAVFSRDDLTKISAEVNTPVGKIINIVNASYQSGGHYLPSSRMHVSAVAIIVATRNIKDDKHNLKTFRVKIQKSLEIEAQVRAEAEHLVLVEENFITPPDQQLVVPDTPSKLGSLLPDPCEKQPTMNNASSTTSSSTVVTSTETIDHNKSKSKQNFCKFCKLKRTNLIQHLLKKHASEEEVKDFPEFPKEIAHGHDGTNEDCESGNSACTSVAFTTFAASTSVSSTSAVSIAAAPPNIYITTDQIIQIEKETPHMFEDDNRPDTPINNIQRGCTTPENYWIHNGREDLSTIIEDDELSEDETYVPQKDFEYELEKSKNEFPSTPKKRKRRLLGRSSEGRTIQQLTSSLSDLLDKLLQKLRDDGGLLQMGTTSWFSMEDTDEEKIQTPSNFVSSARGKFFLGKKTPIALQYMVSGGHK